MQRWNLFFLCGYIVYAVIRGVFERRVRDNQKLLSWFDVRERLLMVALFVGGLLLPALFLFTSVLSFADYKIPWLVSWLGAAVMIAALLLFWRAHADLDRNWSRSLEI